MPIADVSSREDPQDALTLDEETLDPGLHYRFVHPRNLAKRKAQGYEVVLRSETGVKLMSDEESVKTADDLVRFGNTILMSCAISKYNERRIKQSKLSAARLGAGESEFQQGAKRRGVRTITEKGEG